ncbi:hypothetical protein H6F44_21195 [Pseudanabaena sp. FACHB-1277]|uniref:Uncharacterized protein n=1 Tax=Pseudanabaena cinerea FACHB-1277 TaxID=2949581 RepID=A0A926Z8B7_9CYAN|nr:hypothetical protein [Pseudanabaena cinerea]MBD2152615.1 hypothetical protein [Pseudanabaena cinerea FACHB-1277]
MTKDPNFVSVRLPDDVANWLREYATTNNMVRADKPNMGGSIIAIVRAAMQGQTISNNVGQSSDLNESLTERIKDVESANKLLQNELDSRLNKLDEHFASLFVDLRDRVADLENTHNEAIAATTAKLESRISLEIDKIDIRLKAMPDDLEAKLDTIRAQLVNLESRSEATENSKKPMLSVMRAA